MSLKTSVIVDLAGNLQRKAKQYDQAMQGFSRSGQHSMSMLNRSMMSMGRGLDRLGNRYTALLTGAAGVGTVKGVVDLQTEFTRLGIQAGKSDKEMEALKKQIFATAMAADVRVDPDQLLGAVNAIVEKTGDLKFAENNIRNIGIAIQATGAQGGAIGEILAEFEKMGIKVPTEVLKALDTLNVQGKEGAFTLQNLAALGPRVITAYTAMGRTGTHALREMGAALQVIRQGTGSSEQAATSFEALMRVFSQDATLKMMARSGIKVFDVEELKKGRKILRPINQLMEELVLKTKGDKPLIQKILGDSEAARAFNAPISEYLRTHNVSSFHQFMSVQGDGTTTLKDSARAARTASAALTDLHTVWRRFADEKLTGPIDKLTAALNSLTGKDTGKIIQGALIAGGGLFALGKMSRLMGRGKGAGIAGAIGGGLGGMPLPLPVYVVNSKMSLTSEALNDLMGGGGGKGVAGKVGLLRRFGRFAALAAGPIATSAAVGYGVGTVAYNSFSKDTQNAIGSTIAHMLAMLGSDTAKQAVEQERKHAMGELHIKIDQDGRARVKSMKSDGMAMNVDTGLVGGF